MPERCAHNRFRNELKLSWLEVGGLGGGGQPLRQLFMLLKLTCGLCGKNFVFRGNPGASTFEPSVSPDGFQLRAPVDWPEEPEQDESLLTPPTVH